MAAGTVVSGSKGSLTVGATKFEITKWSFATSADTDRYATNETAGYKKTVAGNLAASGSIEGKRVTGATTRVETVLVEGATIALVLELETGTIASGEITVSAVIKGVELEVDVDGGSIESFSCSFESDGAWTWTYV